MAGPNYGLDKGFVADAAIGSAATGPDLATSYDYFLIVKPVAGSPDHVALGAAATDSILGVSQMRVLAADAGTIVADIRLEGITKVVAGGAVAIGDRVTSNASGRAITTTTAGNRVLGVALSTAAANGDLIDVFITPGGQIH